MSVGRTIIKKHPWLHKKYVTVVFMDFSGPFHLRCGCKSVPMIGRKWDLQGIW